ncbi:MAG: GNAT family N-acetyltransferase [Coriobacteriales bacterium]|nr:GNAT family N-acetyltransferase [Coriobacteriales bacterium]
MRLFSQIPRIEDERIVLKRLEDAHAQALWELSHSEEVYRYLPTFLFEQQYEDMHECIAQMYGPLFEREEGIILGIFLKDGMQFCGLFEFYGFRDDMHKISMGYRLLQRHWGKGIASQAVGLAVRYLYTKTEIGLITASTMVENRASARVLQKNGFVWTTQAYEDWGFEEPTLADKWFS